MSGRVVQVTGVDSTPVSDLWAVLHGVQVTGGAPLDSQRTDRLGRFTLRAATVDSGTNYLVSVRYAGIAYFSDPFRPNPPRDSVPTLLVYDTSSSAAVELAERHLLVRGREADGSWRVIEVWVLANRGTRTRVTAEDGPPVWQATLPREAQQFELGLSDVSNQAVALLGDTVAVYAPIPPGERQLILSYLLPGSVREARIPIDQPVERLSVLLEDSAITPSETVVDFRGWEELNGVPLRRFAADSAEAGTAVVLRFPGTGRTPERMLRLLVPVVAAALGLGLLTWWRRSGPAEAAVETPDALAAEIAALDEAYVGNETPEYRRQRAELKQRLKDLLAQRRQSG